MSPLRKPSEYTDEELDAIDSDGPDPNWDPRVRKVPPRPRLPCKDPRVIKNCVEREEYWAVACAFGSSSADPSETYEVSYLDAIMYLAEQRPRRDGRKRYGGECAAEEL